MDITFEQAVDMYRNIVNRFTKIEGKPWGVEGAMIELSKQVGELSKCVMVQENYYCFNTEETEKNRMQIGNELADIIGQTIRIAEHYGINLLEAYIAAREDEDNYLRSKGV
ncbi:MazG-like family protein [Anaerocolumna sp. AGMB13025]|uniref:MazG-like family protein n=1 Tax=Anaerocolumna sp. AGMB13025 TaxID=3039116 RepID=UPI00241CA188|nr:MazG-like family protein [Anaerocolumna sp. AGMB13025]WFR59667.1 MazG-like family protein [Anaerocolumna sp. AGMB13025]